MWYQKDESLLVPAHVANRSKLADDFLPEIAWVFPNGHVISQNSY
jgi:hypothetical protein